METNMRTCASDGCDVVFEVKSGRGKTHQIYCTPECRKRQTSKISITRTQKLGKIKANMARNSRKHHKRKVGQLIIKNHKEKICVLCGDLYIPTSGSQKYCDPDCIELYYGRTEDYMYVIEVECLFGTTPVRLYVGDNTQNPVEFSRAKVFRLKWEAERYIKNSNVINKMEILEITVDDKYRPTGFRDKDKVPMPMPVVTYDRQPVCEDCD